MTSLFWASMAFENKASTPKWTRFRTVIPKYSPALLNAKIVSIT